MIFNTNTWLHTLTSIYSISSPTNYANKIESAVICTSFLCFRPFQTKCQIGIANSKHPNRIPAECGRPSKYLDFALSKGWQKTTTVRLEQFARHEAQENPPQISDSKRTAQRNYIYIYSQKNIPPKKTHKLNLSSKTSNPVNHLCFHPVTFLQSRLIPLEPPRCFGRRFSCQLYLETLCFAVVRTCSP